MAPQDRHGRVWNVPVALGLGWQRRLVGVGQRGAWRGMATQAGLCRDWLGRTRLGWATQATLGPARWGAVEQGTSAQAWCGPAWAAMRGYAAGGAATQARRGKVLLRGDRSCVVRLGLASQARLGNAAHVRRATLVGLSWIGIAGEAAQVSSASRSARHGNAGWATTGKSQQRSIRCGLDLQRRHDAATLCWAGDWHGLSAFWPRRHRMARRVPVGAAGHRGATLGRAKSGRVGLRRRGVVRCRSARQRHGNEPQAWHRSARPSLVSLVTAVQGLAAQCVVRFGNAGNARQCRAGLGLGSHCSARHRRHGTSRHGSATRGGATQAWCGSVSFCNAKARQRTAGSERRGAARAACFGCAGSGHVRQSNAGTAWPCLATSGSLGRATQARKGFAGSGRDSTRSATQA